MTLSSGPNLFFSTSLLSVALSAISPLSSKDTHVPLAPVNGAPEYVTPGSLSTDLNWQIPTISHARSLPEMPQRTSHFHCKGMIDLGDGESYYLIQASGEASMHLVTHGERLPGTHWELEATDHPMHVVLKELYSELTLQLTL